MFSSVNRNVNGNPEAADFTPINTQSSLKNNNQTHFNFNLQNVGFNPLF